MLLDRIIPGVNVYGRTDLRIDSLMWGCLAAIAIHVPSNRNWLHDRLTPQIWSATLVAFIACIVYQPPLALLWISAFVPVLLLGTMLRPLSFPGKMLESRPLRWIGHLSYSLYIWQQFFLLGEGNMPFSKYQRWPWNVCFLFGFAIFSYYCIEQPLIRYGRRLSRREEASESHI